MAAAFPAAIITIAEMIIAGAEKNVVGGDDPLLEPGHGHEDLIGRGWWIFPLDGLVFQRTQRIVDKRIPLVAAEAGDEIVLVEGRAAGQGQDFARVGVQGHGRAGAVLQQLFRPLLQAAVDGEENIVAVAGGHRPEHLHDLAVGVYLHLAPPALTPQVGSQGFFNTEFPDQVAGPAAGIDAALKLFGADLTDVAQQMGRQAAVNVIAQPLNLDVDTGQIVTAGGHHRQFVAADVAFEELGLVIGRPPHAAHLGGQFVHRQGGMHGQAVKGLAHRAGILEADVKVEGRPIFDQQVALPVENEAARRIDALQSNTVVDRHATVFLPLDDLQVDQSQHQNQGGQADAQHDPGQALSKPLAVDGFKIFGHGYRSLRSRCRWLMVLSGGSSAPLGRFAYKIGIQKLLPHTVGATKKL